MRFGLKDVTILATFTAVVCVATAILKVDIPATHGFFNVGDSMIYVTALLFGPVIGGIAGGVGSALADILLGFPWFAPGTFVIKGIEGLIVGYLGHKIRPRVEISMKWEALGIFLGVGLGAIVCYLGFTYYVGVFGNIVGERLFWVVVATLLGIFIAYSGISRGSMVNWQVVSVIFGGIEMIVGYYLYETFLLPRIVPGWEIIAIVEVPFNIGQAVIGLIIAVPIVSVVWRALPYLKV